MNAAAVTKARAAVLLACESGGSNRPRKTGPPRFELELSVPKTDVLPLHHGPVVREDDPRAAARQSDRQLTRVRSRQGRSFIRGEWFSRLERSPSRCRSPPAALPSPRSCSPGTRKSQAPKLPGAGHHRRPMLKTNGEIVGRPEAASNVAGWGGECSNSWQPAAVLYRMGE